MLNSKLEKEESDWCYDFGSDLRTQDELIDYGFHVIGIRADLPTEEILLLSEISREVLGEQSKKNASFHSITSV